MKYFILFVFSLFACTGSAQHNSKGQVHKKQVERNVPQSKPTKPQVAHGSSTVRKPTTSSSSSSSNSSYSSGSQASCASGSSVERYSGGESRDNSSPMNCGYGDDNEFRRRSGSLDTSGASGTDGGVLTLFIGVLYVLGLLITR